MRRKGREGGKRDGGKEENAWCFVRNADGGKERRLM